MSNRTLGMVWHIIFVARSYPGYSLAEVMAALLHLNQRKFNSILIMYFFFLFFFICFACVVQKYNQSTSNASQTEPEHVSNAQNNTFSPTSIPNLLIAVTSFFFLSYRVSVCMSKCSS